MCIYSFMPHKITTFMWFKLIGIYICECNCVAEDLCLG